MRAAIEARGLTKRYDDRVVLDDVTFTVAPGTLAALTGRSGSGKSTLFRLLAGLERATSGDVIVDGVGLSTLDDESLSQLRLRRIGVVFQSFNLLPDLTVAQNVALPMDIGGVPRGEASARAHRLLDLVHMGGHASKMPRFLSGGEAQRVAIARALAMDPPLLLADEPTGNLDEANALNILSLFEEVNARLGTTVLIISHDSLVTSRVRAQLRIDDGRVSWATRPIATSTTTP